MGFCYRTGCCGPKRRHGQALQEQKPLYWVCKGEEAESAPTGGKQCSYNPKQFNALQGDNLQQSIKKESNLLPWNVALGTPGHKLTRRWCTGAAASYPMDFSCASAPAEIHSATPPGGQNKAQPKHQNRECPEPWQVFTRWNCRKYTDNGNADIPWSIQIVSSGIVRRSQLAGPSMQCLMVQLACV